MSFSLSESLLRLFASGHSQHSGSFRGRQTWSPRLEALEVRLAPAVFTVTTNADKGFGSLRNAILSAAANDPFQADTIDFSPALAGQTITLTTNDAITAFGPTGLVITNDNITIDGSAAPGLQISGSNARRVFAVTATGTLTLQSITITSGQAQGGAGGSGPLGGTLGGGGAAGLGGAVFNLGTLNLVQSTLSGNTAQGGAGGNGGTTTGSEQGAGGGGVGGPGGYINGNYNYGGGGGGVGGGGQPNDFNAGGGLNQAGNRATIGTNGTLGGGGGASSLNHFPPGNGLNPSNISGIGGGGGGNGTGGNGGAGGFGSGGGGGGGFGGNGGFGGGGGGGYLGNGGTGGYGAGNGGAAGVTSYGSGGGGGAGMGGAIFNNGGTITITNSTLTGNIASGGAAGFSSNFGQATLAQAGKGLGGAVFNRNGSLTVLNSTLSLNTAPQDGRGIFNLGDAATATATINNTIIGQNDVLDSDFVGKINNGGTSATSGVGSLIRTAAGFAGTIVSSADPQLGGLTNNGGPTATMRPTGVSPAINGGDNIAAASLTLDQTGRARLINGTVDIGAFEEIFAATITSPNNTAFTVGEPGSFTFSATANPNATFSVTAGTLPFGITLDSAGVLSGTPASGGVFTFTVTANNGVGSSFNQSFTLTVNVASTTTTLASALTPTTFGQVAAFTATVTANSPSTATPTGFVSFFDGAALLGISTLAGGLASLNTSVLQVGSHDITAVLNASSGFGTSTSNIVTQQVNSGLGGGGTVATANGDVFSLPENSNATALGVLLNDLGSGLTITLVTQPISGLVAITGGGSGLTYQPNHGFSGVDSFTYTISDGINTSTATAIVAVTPVNQAPTITAPSSAFMVVNSNATITGVSVSDPDSAGGAEKVTISTAGFGTLSLGSTGGLTFSLGDGTADTTMTFTGTITAINNALAGLTYRGNGTDTTNSDTITIGIDDQGNAGVGGALTASVTINITPSFNTAEVVSDPFKAGTTALVINGGSGNDTILVNPNGSVKNSFLVTINGNTQTFNGVTGRILVFGQDGNDTITMSTLVKKQTLLSGGNGNDVITGGSGIDFISGGLGTNTINGGAGTGDSLVEKGDFSMTLVQGTTKVNGSLTTTGGLTDVLVLNRIECAQLTSGDSGNTLDASAFTGNVTLIGGAGADTLKGGKKNNILVGNGGNDTLNGGAGKNVMIGGAGADTLNGNAGQDLMIGGSSAFDNNIAALNGIMLEWGGTTVYATKIKHLLGTQTGGKNGTILLNTTTVTNDGQVNKLTGGAGLDWFFKSSADGVMDANNGGTETITSIP